MAAINQTTVNSTAAALTAGSTPVTEYTIIKAMPTNAADVYVGFANTVTPANGFVLQKGEEMSISVGGANNGSKIFLISSLDGQAVCYQIV
jgi:hypothetical protein